MNRVSDYVGREASGIAIEGPLGDDLTGSEERLKHIKQWEFVAVLG